MALMERGCVLMLLLLVRGYYEVMCPE